MKGVFHSKEWWAASLFVLFPGLIDIIAQSADGIAKLLLWIYVDVLRKWVLWDFLHFGYCLVAEKGINWAYPPNLAVLGLSTTLNGWTYRTPFPEGWIHEVQTTLHICFASFPCQHLVYCYCASRLRLPLVGLLCLATIIHMYALKCILQKFALCLFIRCICLFFFILSGLVAALLTDKSFDKKQHLRNCPNLILYRNKVPVAYDGGL